MLSRDRLPTTRVASIEFYQRFLTAAAGKSEFHLTQAKRWLARNDLFYLLTAVCKRKDINRDWLFARCREVERDPNGFLDLWAREHYKLHRLDEPVPTPTGWKAHGALEPGDEIFGPDGKPCLVVARTPVFDAPPMHRITFDDGFQILAGDDHLWEVERKTRKRIPLAYNTDGPKRQYRETVVVSTLEIARHDHRADNRLAVRVNDPLELPSVDLPIHPYVLGVWLGDGTTATGDVTCADPEIFAEIATFGYVVGHDKAPTRSADTRRVDGLSASLKRLGLRGNKSIPARFLRASAEQRLALLQGLMDTDGHCNTRGTATFVNTNEALVDGFCELAHGLGLKPRRREHIGEHAGAPYAYWQVSFQAYKALPPFRLPRKLARCRDGARPNPRRYIVSCERVAPEPGSCIQVDRSDGLYLVGRNMVTTHNSTIITFGLSLQDILASHGDEPEARYRGREVTIGILSFNRPTAKAFLRQIKQEVEQNDDLKALFPDVLWGNPQFDSPKWSEDDGLIVRRKTNPKEATIEAHGLVDGQPTGKHYFIRVYDDVVTRESVTTPEMILKTTAAWELSDNLGTDGGWTRTAGTRYHLFDTYSVMADRGVASRVHPCTTDGSEDWSKSVLLSPEVLANKRRLQGPYTFGAQMLLNPTADRQQGFKEEWLRYWSPVADSLNVYIIVDPASKKKKTSDYTSMWVIGLGGDENIYILDGVRDRLNLTERQKALFKLHRRWRPKGVGYEEYGLQADIEHMESVMKLENYRFSITPLGGQLAKEDRIKRLVPKFEAGMVYLPETLIRLDHESRSVDLTRVFREEEYLAFPVCAHDDMLDCMSRILDEDLMVSFPMPEQEPEQPKWMQDLEGEMYGGDAMTA